MEWFPIAFLAMEDPASRAFMMGLYKDHHRLMYAVAYKAVGDRQMLDDIVGDALTALIRKTETITQLERHSLKAYVVSTVRNTSLNHIKAQSRRRAHFVYEPDEAFDRIASDETVDGALLRQEQIDAVRHALERVGGRDAVLLDMKYRRNLSDAEIGGALGIKPDSVRQALKRARAHVFEQLRSEGVCDE